METNQLQPVQERGKPKLPGRKRTATFSRWLHIYLSMLSFLIVLFFSITGLTLNHAEWFDGKQVEKKITGNLPIAWVKTPDTGLIRKLEIVELLRKKYSIKGSMSEFLIQPDQCAISFKGPGYSADAFVSRKDGSLHVTELRLGLVAVLNDLHKGRDSGSAWSWVIDVSAGFLTLVSLSGLTMIFFMKKKRQAGLLLGLLGGIICLAIYYLFAY